jgi:hypothetical protein
MRMSSRAAEFASAILIGVLAGVFAGAYLIVMPYGTADDCLAQPNGDAPQGQHWYYRIDRGTKRHCWYLKGQGEKVARAASPERATPAKTASPKTDVTAQRSVADARAELPSRARIEDDTSAFATRPAPAPIIANAAASAANTAAADDNGTGSNVMSRWPEPTGVNSTADTPPESPPMVVADNTQPGPTAAAPIASAPTTSAPVTTQTMSAAPADVAAAAPTAASTATASMAVEKYSGSLQELLVVAFAALALAGLTGSAVYRLASLRHAKRRYNASRRSADWQAPKKKRKARPAQMKPEHVAPSAEFATQANFAPQTNFAPRREFAPRANFAPENFTPEPVSEYAPRANFVPPQDPVSEYAPKPKFSHAGAQTQSNDNFEAIEELLMRLAK